jgi:mRNA interferase RelE/StbE
MSKTSGFAFSDAALKFLSTVPKKLRGQIIKKARDLELNPHPPGSRPLKGCLTAEGDRIYRERSGDYRILYVVSGNPGHVLVLDIDNRKDVYR